MAEGGERRPWWFFGDAAEGWRGVLCPFRVAVVGVSGRAQRRWTMRVWHALLLGCWLAIGERDGGLAWGPRLADDGNVSAVANAKVLDGVEGRHAVGRRRSRTGGGRADQQTLDTLCGEEMAFNVETRGDERPRASGRGTRDKKELMEDAVASSKTAEARPRLVPGCLGQDCRPRFLRPSREQGAVESRVVEGAVGSVQQDPVGMGRVLCCYRRRGTMQVRGGENPDCRVSQPPQKGDGTLRWPRPSKLPLVSLLASGLASDG